MKWENIKRNEKKIWLGVALLFLISMVVGVSYAYIAYTTKQEGINVVKTDCINVKLEELTNALEIKEAYPMSDEAGKNSKPYRFRLTNTCGVGVDYNIHLEVQESEKRIASNNIAVNVDGKEKKRLTESIRGSIYYEGVESYKIESNQLRAGESIIHSVRIWLDQSAGNETQNGTFQSKIVIEAIQNQVVDAYKEENLKGADPVLSENLIPVEIDENGKVTKANVTTEWYNYGNKRWANAVILEDESKTYQNGEEIPESNIESYFVWIPKYSYQLWDLGEYQSLTTIDESKVHEIAIRFGIENTSDTKEGECKTPGTSGTSGNCQVGDYMTHPAFLAFGANGLWVGKFESGYKGATTTASAQVNTSDSNKLQIKPNVYSWRGIQVANAHQVSYNYKRELESHMMKNTEWGAVAYLQHSKYGSSESVRINNNASYITGYSATKEPTCGYTGSNESCNQYEGTSLGVDGNVTINYKNPSSVVASTTGNYTGIYDMSGEAWEIVMGIMADSTNQNPMSGKNSSEHSGFNGPYSEGGSLSNGIDFPDSRYYDIYQYDTSYTAYNQRILGDATGELGPFSNAKSGSQTRQISSWYQDEQWFIKTTALWFGRGGHFIFGQGSGIFDFIHGNGVVSQPNGFRTVLAI